MLLNDAVPETTFAVMSSGIAKVYVLSFALPTHTIPAFKVNVGVFVLVDTSNDICALDAFLERGKYPIFDARETTFSLKVAESKKDSFTIILELNAVIYVLYAKVSIKTEKLDPSKSKSVNVELARR